MRILISEWWCIMAAYCDMALLFFIENEPPLPEVKHRASGFFCSGWFQLYSNYSEFPNCSKLPWNRAIISSLMYQGLDYQITDVIQLNRAKFIFNRAEKKKPNICFARCPAVSDFKRTTTLMIYKWVNKSTVRKSDFQKCTIWNWTQYSNLSEKLTGSIF